jgi:hypothetical protein
MTATLTAGQIFARDMRKNLGIGTRTRRFKGYSDKHAEILECIQHAIYDAGWYTERRENIFRTARGAWFSYDKHIAGYRVNSNVIAHINSLSPWQFCNLLGEMVDANITNVGEGERWFAALSRRLYAQAA